MDSLSTKTLFKAASTAADIYSDWIDTLGMAHAVVHLDLANTSSPVGSFKVEYSNDYEVVLREKTAIVNNASSGNGIATKRGATSEAKKVDVSSSIPASAIAGTGLTVGGANATIITLVCPARFVRVWYDQGSGGGAAALNGWIHLGG